MVAKRVRVVFYCLMGREGALTSSGSCGLAVLSDMSPSLAFSMVFSHLQFVVTISTCFPWCGSFLVLYFDTSYIGDNILLYEALCGLGYGFIINHTPAPAVEITTVNRNFHLSQSIG